MSATQLTLVQRQNEITVVSTSQLGAPGPAGPPGAAGTRGSSGLPGTDVDLSIVSGNFFITVTTHWWIDTDGSIYYEDDPAAVPTGKEAWFNPSTFTVVPGLPGAGAAITIDASFLADQADLRGTIATDFDGNGRLTYSVVTSHWGVDSSGQPYFNADATAIPSSERAFFEPTTGTILQAG